MQQLPSYLASPDAVCLACHQPLRWVVSKTGVRTWMTHEMLGNPRCSETYDRDHVPASEPARVSAWLAMDEVPF